MTSAKEAMARLAALLCDGEEVELEDLRAVLAQTLEPAMTDPATGPAEVVAWADAQVRAGHGQVWLYPSDAPRVAWELAQAQAPTTVCCVLGYPAGRALADALCFEGALMMAGGVAELALVANTGALLEGTLDEVVEPLASLLGTVHADEDGCGCEDGDACSCGHRHHGDEEGCGCHDEDCTCGEDDCGCHEDEAPAVSVMLECGLMTPDLVCRACDLVSSCGADFVVAATGEGPRFASAADVRLLCATVEPGVGVKAFTDAVALDDALALLDAGACALVCTHPAQIMEDFDRLAHELDV